MRRITIDGFADVSGVLAAGVYVLALAGRVVYVGRAKRMGDLVSAHKRLSRRAKPWCPVPGIEFDQVLIRPCHPDAVDALVAELIAQHRPRANLDPRIVPFRRAL
jgi:hypothetical protein